MGERRLGDCTVVGDSNTAGYGPPPDAESFPEILGCTACGAPGHGVVWKGVATATIAVRRAVHTHPSLIVVSYLTNDVDEVSAIRGDDHADPLHLNAIGHAKLVGAVTTSLARRTPT